MNRPFRAAAFLLIGATMYFAQIPLRMRSRASRASSFGGINQTRQAFARIRQGSHRYIRRSLPEFLAICLRKLLKALSHSA